MNVTDKQNPRIALVHDWLPTVGGGEHVLAELAGMYANAEIFTLFDFLDRDERAYVTAGRPLHVSSLSRLPGVQRYYRYLLLECSRAVERFDLRGYDAVISSSAALAKGVIVGVDQPHVAYIHSPPRYAWDLTHDYLDAIQGPLAGLRRALAHRMLHRFRMWDRGTVVSIDKLVANSDFVRRRIARVYGRDAQVVHPPVDVDAFALNAGGRCNRYVTAGRFVPYKNTVAILQAFAARPDLYLDVIGSGPEEVRLRAMSPPNVTFTGWLPRAEVVSRLQSARAFVFAAIEDFGIVPVEAQACGTPVIAPSIGGTAETVRDLSNAAVAPTGILYDPTDPTALTAALDRFESAHNDFDPHAIRAHAETFAAPVFRTAMQTIVTDVLAAHSR